MQWKNKEECEGNAVNNGNLKPWKPGQSGNPKGKPKGVQNMVTVMNQYLESGMLDGFIAGEDRTLTFQQRLTLYQIGQALTGDARAYISVLRRLKRKDSEKLAQKLEDAASWGWWLTPPSIKLKPADERISQELQKEIPFKRREPHAWFAA